MGIRIYTTSGTITVVKPFPVEESGQHTVQLWCNVQTNEHNLIFGKSPSKKKPVFLIEFSLPVFRALALNGTDELKAFVKKLKSGRAQNFSASALPLNADMQQCIYKLIHYEGDEAIKSMYLYAYIIQLVMLQQQNYLHTLKPKAVYVKNEYDKERIIFARDYLLTHMDAPPTLPQLASIAGINEFKLKRGFRELFNHSVFGYLAEVRLNMARTALQQKQKTVTQIAFELGYASLQHFSGAFKKKFGISPARFTG